MKLSTATILAVFLSALTVYASPTAIDAARNDTLHKRAITQDQYDDLVRYWKYATGAALDSCPSPLGNTLVQQISEPITDTQAYIARDDTRKEILIAFRGTTSNQDALTDFSIPLVPFFSPGVKAPIDAFVHLGFLTSWNAIAGGAIATFKNELIAHPGYNIVSIGHSLGGALASVAGIALQQNFPDSHVRLFTYGQPRVGNKQFANFVNDNVGTGNLYRSVHTDDGVPTVIPRWLGYHHHGTEYWQYQDPFSLDVVKQCDPSGEDVTCSDSIPTKGLTEAHGLYYGILSDDTFCHSATDPDTKS